MDEEEENQVEAVDGSQRPRQSQDTNTFAPTPGIVDINKSINCCTCVGAELCKTGSKSLPINFNGEEETLTTFTNVLIAHSREMG